MENYPRRVKPPVLKLLLFIVQWLFFFSSTQSSSPVYQSNFTVGMRRQYTNISQISTGISQTSSLRSPKVLHASTTSSSIAQDNIAAICNKQYLPKSKLNILNHKLNKAHSDWDLPEDIFDFKHHTQLMSLNGDNDLPIVDVKDGRIPQPSGDNMPINMQADIYPALYDGKKKPENVMYYNTRNANKKIIHYRNNAPIIQRDSKSKIYIGVPFNIENTTYPGTVFNDYKNWVDPTQINIIPQYNNTLYMLSKEEQEEIEQARIFVLSNQKHDEEFQRIRKKFSKKPSSLTNKVKIKYNITGLTLHNMLAIMNNFTAQKILINYDIIRRQTYLPLNVMLDSMEKLITTNISNQRAFKNILSLVLHDIQIYESALGQDRDFPAVSISTLQRCINDLKHSYETHINRTDINHEHYNNQTMIHILNADKKLWEERFIDKARLQPRGQNNLQQEYASFSHVVFDFSKKLCSFIRAWCLGSIGHNIDFDNFMENCPPGELELIFNLKAHDIYNMGFYKKIQELENKIRKNYSKAAKRNK